MGTEHGEEYYEAETKLDIAYNEAGPMINKQKTRQLTMQMKTNPALQLC